VFGSIRSQGRLRMRSVPSTREFFVKWPVIPPNQCKACVVIPGPAGPKKRGGLHLLQKLVWGMRFLPIRQGLSSFHHICRWRFQCIAGGRNHFHKLSCWGAIQPVSMGRKVDPVLGEVFQAITCWHWTALVPGPGFFRSRVIPRIHNCQRFVQNDGATIFR